MKEPDLLESIRHNNKIMEDSINLKAIRKGLKMRKVKATQSAKILLYLLSGKSLTGLQALQKFGTMKLSTRISELIKSGCMISKEFVHKNGKTFMKYYI